MKVKFNYDDNLPWKTLELCIMIIVATLLFYKGEKYYPEIF